MPSSLKKCHREGCDGIKRRGRSYRYCSDECATLVALAVKRIDSAAWRDGHRTEIRARQLWVRYRLTIEQFDAMLAAQDGLCAICQTDTPGGSGAWHVDHNHACCPGRKSCGECLRGLLCARCNFFVLSVVEGPLLEAAMAYLEGWRS